VESLPANRSVAVSDDLLAELRAVLGENNVRVTYKTK